MATMTVTSLKAPLLDDIESTLGAAKGCVGATVTPKHDEEIRFEIIGSIWSGIWCFLMHAIMAFFVASFSYIPYVGESPVWLRAIMVVASVFVGVLDHLVSGITFRTHSKLDNLWKVMLLPGLVGLVLFHSKLYMVLPVWEVTSLLFAFLVLLVVPGVVYKKATGKEAPGTHSEIMDSLTTWAGVALHNGTDTALALYFVLCWNLMGSPLLMGWLQ